MKTIINIKINIEDADTLAKIIVALEDIGIPNVRDDVFQQLTAQVNKVRGAAIIYLEK